MGRRRRKRAADDWGQDNWDNNEWDEESFNFGDDFEEGFGEASDFSVTNFYPDPYCSRVGDLKTQCFQESILELWANKGVFDEKSDEAIAGLTKDDIVDKINSGNFSGFYLRDKDFSSMLSNIRRNSEGQIVSASATIMKWMGRMNATLALLEPADDSGTRGELVDLATDRFEKDLAKTLLKYQDTAPENVRVEVNVANSFGEIASGTIWGDTGNLILGFSIVFIYVNIMLGKFNHVEQRVRNCKGYCDLSFMHIVTGLLVTAGSGFSCNVDWFLLWILLPHWTGLWPSPQHDPLPHPWHWH